MLDVTSALRFNMCKFLSASMVGIYVSYTQLTSVLSVRYEVEHKTEADSVPTFTVLRGIHEQEVLFLDRRVPRMQVNGRDVNPCGAGSVVVWLQCANFEESRNFRTSVMPLYRTPRSNTCRNRAFFSFVVEGTFSSRSHAMKMLSLPPPLSLLWPMEDMRW